MVGDARVEVDLAAELADVVGERGRHRREVDDARVRRAQRRHPAHVRLEAAISSARSRSSPGTPLARPRRSSSSSPASCAGDVATISFPQRRTGTSRSAQ